MEAEFMKEATRICGDQLPPLLSESNNHDKRAVAIYLDGVLVGPRPEL